MTTKLNFLKGACAVFNCTPSVILNACAGEPSAHPETSKEIKKWASKSCNATAKDWKELAARVNASPIAHEVLWAMVSGAEIKLATLP